MWALGPFFPVASTGRAIGSLFGIQDWRSPPCPALGIERMSAPRVRHLSLANATTHYGLGLFTDDYRGGHRER